MINNNVAFKGYIIVQDVDNKWARPRLETDKILKIEDRAQNTRITYDVAKEVRHNGYTYTEPTTICVNTPISNVLAAYNATKDTDLTVDLS